MAKLSLTKAALLLGLSCGTVATFTTHAFSTTTAATADASKVVAKFADGTTVTMQEVQDLISQLPPKLREVPFSKLYVGILNRLVDSKVLYAAAVKANLHTDAEVTKRIAEAKELLLQKAYLDIEVDKLITDAVLLENYNRLVQMLPKDEMEVEVAHILFDTKEDAEKTLAEIKAAGRKAEAKFTELVSRSTDKSTKTKEGLVGWLRRPDVSNETLMGTEKGKVVPEVLKIFDQGYSVFFVKDKRPVQAPKFEEIKSNVKMAVLPQYAIQVVDKMRRDSGLKMTGLDKQPLALPDLPPMPDPTGKAPEKKAPERKDFSAIDEKSLDGSMVVGEFKSGEKITLAQVRESLTSLPEQLKGEPFHKLFEPLLLRVADTKLLIAAAKTAKLDQTADLLKKQEDAQKAMVQNAYISKQSAESVNAEMLKEAYQEFLKVFPKDEMEIRIKHIMVATKEEAETILKELKSGKAKFDEAYVKSKSIDPQTKETGGDLGYIPRKQLPPELGDVLSKQAKATFVPEPISLGENGFSVIRVEDKRTQQPPSIEEIRPQLSQAVSQREAAKIIMKLREEQKVEMKDLDGNILANPALPAADKK